MLVALLLYYPAGMAWIHNIDDDVKLAVDVKPNESRSVAVAGDTVFVGAQGNDDGGTGSGSVYVFRKTDSGATYDEVETLRA